MIFVIERGNDDGGLKNDDGGRKNVGRGGVCEFDRETALCGALNERTRTGLMLVAYHAITEAASLIARM